MRRGCFFLCRDNLADSGELKADDRAARRAPVKVAFPDGYDLNGVATPGNADYIAGFYIFAGYLIRKHANTSADRHPLFISLGTFIISLAISALVVEAIPKIGFWYNNVCLVPTSASLFIFLHSLDFHSSVRRNEIFALLSKASFGIYLVHYPILLYLSTIFDRPAQSFRNLISLFALSLISSMFIVLATRHTPKIGRALFRM